jgi:hypothetical protein
MSSNLFLQKSTWMTTRLPLESLWSLRADWCPHKDGCLREKPKKFLEL